MITRSCFPIERPLIVALKADIAATQTFSVEGILPLSICCCKNCRMSDTGQFPRVSTIRFTPSLKHCPFTGIQTSHRRGSRFHIRVHHSARQLPLVYRFPQTIHMWSFHHSGLGCQTEPSAWDRRSRLSGIVHRRAVSISSRSGNQCLFGQ